MIGVKDIKATEDEFPEDDNEDEYVGDLMLSRKLVGENYLTILIMSLMGRLGRKKAGVASMKAGESTVKVVKYIRDVIKKDKLNNVEVMILIDSLYRTAALDYYKKFGDIKNRDMSLYG